MKVVLVVCTYAVTVLVAAGAPAPANKAPEVQIYENLNTQGKLRGKRSQYGGAYVQPCAAAQLPALGPSPYLGPIHGIHSAIPSYGGGLAYGGAPHGYPYAPHYRADEMDGEMMNFPDMEQGMTEHMPMARYGGGGYGSLGPAIATGPAFGVFPNANVGGCNVPLLLSCSPSIVPGRLVKGHGYGGYGASVVPAYRGVDEPHQEEHDENVEKQSTQEHAEGASENTNEVHH